MKTGPLIVIGYFTNVRLGELPPIQWNQFDG